MAKIVNSCKRALDILELFLEHKDGLTIREISEQINAPLTTCVDIVHTLDAKGYLIFQADKKCYVPSGRLFFFGQQLAASGHMLFAQQQVDELNRSTNETTLLTMFSAQRVLVVYVKEASHPLRYAVMAGERLAFHSSASGKGMLSQMEDNVRDQILSELTYTRVTDKTIHSRKKLEEEIALSSKQGWFNADEEAYTGIYSMAVPFTIQGEIYCISLVGPKERILSNKSQYSQQLLEIKNSFLAQL